MISYKIVLNWNYKSMANKIEQMTRNTNEDIQKEESLYTTHRKIERYTYCGRLLWRPPSPPPTKKKEEKHKGLSRWLHRNVLTILPSRMPLRLPKLTQSWCYFSRNSGAQETLLHQDKTCRLTAKAVLWLPQAFDGSCKLAHMNTHTYEQSYMCLHTSIYTNAITELFTLHANLKTIKNDNFV